GVFSFTYDGIQETLYYVPVEGTDWMLTYLIRESVINEQINSISDGIIKRSLVQSVLTALVLVAVFTFMIIQLRKNAKLTLEKEVSETENRVRQQELEEQVAMQEELLEQEKKKAEQDKMITAMASDYRSVYYVDLDADESICYRSDFQNIDGVKEGEYFSFQEKFSEYAEEYVDEEYREGFLAFIEPSAIQERLKLEKLLVYRYLIHRDGKESYEMLRMAGVRHAGEREDDTVHAVGVGFTDIDAEMRDSLEKSQALSDALQVAEEASKAKTVFLSNMSHEIRTPMNAIIGLDNLALNDPEISDGTREYLEKIGNSAKHLLDLINDILDMSRIESGRMVIRSEEFSFSKLMEQVGTIISGLCREKGLTYDCRINGEIDDYYIGDDMKLRQIMINILGNAVKFTPKGGKVEFIVTKTAGYDRKSTLRFEMKDTGIGMSKDYLPKIFETFSQEDALAANKYGSSGLGMAITKNIVEMMNGKIEVESEKGKGTTFTVTVTLLDSDRKNSGEDGDLEIVPGEMSVLVVDDDKIAGEHAKLILEKVGISAEVAFSGKEAVEMVKLHHARRELYNLIIVDWQMPEMDGVETTKQIRAVVGNESAIIILTAYNWDDVLDEAVEAGVDSFIAKPLFSGNLLDEFKKALKKKKMTTAKEKGKADLEGRRILLAEDVDINAEIMMEILAMEGMETDHAENGKIVVEMFSAHPEGYYDAILMDMRMPEMDGLEATKAIRALEREDAKKIPIIALTANAFDEDVQRSLQAGLNAHLSKPVDPDILYETLGNMIDG
ncbi:MAG: response regulator, partial [Lachnospiraceae bacterium]|nr:response regulator [Lachnospiraceae bacterium]